MLRALAAALSAILLLAAAAAADQADPRLDALFARLQGADAAEAARIDQEIWTIWLQSGDAEIDRLLEHGALAMAGRVWPAALAAFDAVVARMPDFAEGWNKRATLHYLMENYDASIRDVERTLALEPRHYGALSGMGLIQLRLGREEDAVSWFRRALAVNPHLDGIREIADRLELRPKGKPI